ncbi:DNA-binding protein [Streptomyces sp. NPDC005329]|uniref:DNA-binding protein n=1 Tax=Streptomyces sp. NPDC005329 TaxID=3157034 RepID=UPI0033B74D6D
MKRKADEPKAEEPKADEWLSPVQVCDAYPMFVSPAALADRRWRGDGPDYVKTAPARSGRVYYRRSAIERWLNDRTISCGGAAA